jgi:hypothetical protein
MPGAHKPRCPLDAATNTPASANTATLNTARMMIMAAPWSRLRAEPQRPTAALVPPAEGAAAVCVWHRRNTQASLLRKGTPGQNSASAREDIRLAHGLGDCNGRNLVSAFMWGRVHNRNRDRGGKSVRRLGVGRELRPRSVRRTGGFSLSMPRSPLSGVGRCRAAASARR